MYQFANESANFTANETDILYGQPTVRSICLGVMIFVMALPGLIGNILVSYVQIRTGLLSYNNLSIHNLSFNLMLADTIHLALIAFYLAPASALQSKLLPDNWVGEIPGRLLILCWHNMLLDLCVLGINRWEVLRFGIVSHKIQIYSISLHIKSLTLLYTSIEYYKLILITVMHSYCTYFRYVAVCKPESYTVMFSKRNTRIMIVGTWVGSAVLLIIGEELLPCCR